MKPSVALLIGRQLKDRIIKEKQLSLLKEAVDLRIGDVEKFDVDSTKDLIKSCDACITCWGSTPFNKEILEQAPDLKLIAHSAGSVKFMVSDEIWNRGIKVTSAAAANGISVAEHTLGMIIALVKRSFWLNDAMHKGEGRNSEHARFCRGMYDINIGIVGAGHIGRHLIKLLKAFQVNIYIYDPFLTEQGAVDIGAVKVEELNQLISISDVLSLHAPNIPETHHMLNSSNLKLLREGTVLINTARGALIDEKALYEEAKTGRFIACLDVTDPEPMEKDNPLLTLPNIILTPHIAGALSNDCARMGEYAVREILNFFSGKPLVYEVKREDLSRMA